MRCLFSPEVIVHTGEPKVSNKEKKPTASQRMKTSCPAGDYNLKNKSIVYNCRWSIEEVALHALELGNLWAFIPSCLSHVEYVMHCNTTTTLNWLATSGKNKQLAIVLTYIFGKTCKSHYLTLDITAGPLIPPPPPLPPPTATITTKTSTWQVRSV